MLPQYDTPVAFAVRHQAPRRRNQERHSLKRLNHNSNVNAGIPDDDNDGYIYSLQWEESLREKAAEALVPVFYGPEYHVNANEDAVGSNRNITKSSLNNRGVDPEKALKKVLRQYQKSVEGGDNNTMPTTVQERQTSRKRLSDLILGTSVMRIRHFYTFLAKKISKDDAFEYDDRTGPMILLEASIAAGNTLNVEPIIGVDLGMRANSVAAKMFNSKSHLGERKVSSSHRITTTRALVDLHAQYLQSQNDNLREDDIRYLESHNFQSASERISILHSLPFFFVKMLVEQYGASKTENMAAIFNQPGPITIRRNSIKCPSDNLLCERLRKEDEITTVPLSTESLLIHHNVIQDAVTALFPTGCIKLVVNHQWSPSKKSIWSLDSWKDGWFEVQDTGSQLIVEAAEVSSGDIVIDFCAGNGGKTFALVSQMYQEAGEGKGKGGYIIAHDIAGERLRQLRGSFDRIGLNSENLKGSHPSSSSPGIHVKTTLDEGIELHSEMADVVLVDAPCSSTGVLRRRPSQRFQLQEEEVVSKFPALQAEILTEASNLVNANGKGRLVYATCSICKHENEEVVKKFESQADFFTHWKRWDFQDYDGISSTAGDASSRHCRTLLPNQDSDGFFMARWIRLQNT